MEMWLILVAAGSGYLAKCWQNAQKNKRSVSEQAGSVSDSSRGRHHGLSSTDRRHAHNTWGTGKWQGFRQTSRIRSITGSSKPIDDDESPTNEVGNSVVGNSFECSVNVGTSDRENYSVSQKPVIGLDSGAAENIDDLEGADIPSNDVESSFGSFLPKTGHCSDDCGGALSAISISVREIPVLDGCTENALNHKAEGDHKCHSSENLGKRALHGRDEFVNVENEDLHQVGSRGGKRTKEEVCQGGHVMEHEESATILAYNFRDESGFDDTLQPGNSLRKMEIPNRLGKGRGSLYRRRALQTSTKPMSSLESCLFAQLTGESDMFSGPVSSSFLSSPVANQRPLIITDGNRIINKSGISPLLLQFPNVNYALSSDNVNKLKEDETAFGLPSLLTRDLKKPRCKRKELLEKIQVNRLNRLNGQNSGNAGVIVADSALLKRRKMSQYDASTSTSDTSPDMHFQIEDTSVGCLLFSFGVGVGVMSTIMSSRREIEKLNELLRQSEELVQDLQEELEMRDSLTVKDLTDKGHICVETCQDPFVELDQRRDVSSDALLEKDSEIGERTLFEESGQKMEPMIRVQAELEAELERLELNLNSSKHWRDFSGLSEIDPDCIVDVVHGELRGDDLMGNADSQEGSMASTHEEVHTGNFAVSPRDLTLRLHEVMETRLHERIKELEAELEVSQNKLWAIGIKHQQSKELNQSSQSFNSGAEVPVGGTAFTGNQNGISACNTCSLKASFNCEINQKEFGQCLSEERSDWGPLRKGLINDSYLGSDLMNFNRTGNADLETQNNDEENAKDSQNLPLFVSLSGDALSAYNEAYDEFMKVTREKNVCFFNSAEHKDVALSKQSIRFDNLATKHLSQADCPESNGLQIFHCHEEGDLYHKASNGISHPDPVPLLSTRYLHMVDFYPQPSQPIVSSRSVQSFTSLKQKELYFEGIGLKGVDFPDNVVEDTSGSTPCSLKFVDATDSVNGDSCCDKSFSIDAASASAGPTINTYTSCRMDESFSDSGARRVERAQLQMPQVSYSQAGPKERFPAVSNLPEVSTLVLDKIRSWKSLAANVTSEPEADESLAHMGSHCELPESSSPASDESDCVSEADEQLGKLLIKRIIEKTKQGSPILRDAKSMLASLDNNDF